jgi:hypothetical protein
MPILPALRAPLLQIFRVAVVITVLGLVVGVWQDDPDKLIWDATLRFCLHVIVPMAIIVAIAAPILGGILIYRRIRLRLLSGRMRRHLGK